jgi:hypothetical protein
VNDTGFATLEWFYDALAAELDGRSGPRREVYLAKVALLMAQQIADRETLADLLARAGAGDVEQD